MTKLTGEFQIEKTGSNLTITVTSFSSSDIDIKLSAMNNLDWRAAVDHIAIDLDYDNKKLKPDIIDRPEAAIDYVEGSYSIAAKKAGISIAVKITDILGESVILTRTTEE